MDPKGLESGLFYEVISLQIISQLVIFASFFTSILEMMENFREAPNYVNFVDIGGVENWDRGNMLDLSNKNLPHGQNVRDHHKSGEVVKEGRESPMPTARKLLEQSLENLAVKGAIQGAVSPTLVFRELSRSHSIRYSLEKILMEQKKENVYVENGLSEDSLFFDNFKILGNPEILSDSVLSVSGSSTGGEAILALSLAKRILRVQEGTRRARKAETGVQGQDPSQVAWAALLVDILSTAANPGIFQVGNVVSGGLNMEY